MRTARRWSVGANRTAISGEPILARLREMRWHAHSVASSLCGMFVRLVLPVYELCLAAELTVCPICFVVVPIPATPTSVAPRKRNAITAFWNQSKSRFPVALRATAEPGNLQTEPRRDQPPMCSSAPKSGGPAAPLLAALVFLRNGPTVRRMD